MYWPRSKNGKFDFLRRKRKNVEVIVMFVVGQRKDPHIFRVHAPRHNTARAPHPRPHRFKIEVCVFRE